MKIGDLVEHTRWSKRKNSAYALGILMRPVNDNGFQVQVFCAGAPRPIWWCARDVRVINYDDR